MRPPPFEINERTVHSDHSFVVGSCWRIIILCVSCDLLYTISSRTIRVETVVLSKVCASAVPLLYIAVLRISVNIGTAVSFAAMLILSVVDDVF